MFNLFKKKPIILDCYTDKKYVYDFAPIMMAKDAIPKWFKKIPTSYKREGDIAPQTTMRTCVGFIEQFSHGVFIPMWSDLSIKIGALGTQDWAYQFSDLMSTAEVHSPVQRGSFLPEDKYQHIKLNCPWLFKCDEDIMWECIAPTYNLASPDKMLIAPGIVSYKYQHGTNVNLFFPKEEVDTVHTISHGQPLVQVFPVSERPLIVRQHLLSKEEMSRLLESMVSIKFLGKYSRIKNIMKGKCPYGGA